MLKKSIIGGPIGDIIGSVYEENPVKSLDFQLFNEKSRFTDDTVMTVAVADWLLNKKDLIRTLQEWGLQYKNRGFGWNFYCWLRKDNPLPYNSFGNGSAMRVGPIGYYAEDEKMVLKLAKESASVSHNHPEGIKGAQAIALSVFLANQGFSKNEIRSKIENLFDYDLQRDCKSIKAHYSFDSSCQGSCPESIIAFLESTDYENAIRLAIYLGGDSDTIGCMAGSIASAFYGVPEGLYKQAMMYLSDDMRKIITTFDSAIIRHNHMVNCLK